MKRIQEKVKDIVEVRAYESLRDFTDDPAVTLAGYHFTDQTSDLMAKWLDKIAGVQGGNGTACALAGYRGVGKSHFLAALTAIAAQPELRSRIADNHVAASAQRLLRRHYAVAYVRRGTFDTLLEELQHSIAEALKIEKSAVGGTPKEIFDLVGTVNGDIPFLLIIDTAIERGQRVARDDGGFLGQIASEVTDRNIFLGVALDDDIAGADGVNSAIARTFQIDYLDQEHLYKVVNAHIFPKQIQMQPVLHEVYGYFREVLPDFRWSEQRFSSLYPLHPAILEIAPFVRLYVHDFALLGFASEAGERILGRPANSLIALDEVFDSAERGLRKVDDLADAFAGYDRLNAEVVGKIPVMQRLQAKLILKALLLLSLDGQGTTAGEICAGMLIFDEEDPAKAAGTVEELIQTFAGAMPEYIQTDDTGGELRYRFKVSSKDGLNKALARAVDSSDPDIVNERLLRLFDDRFSDASLAEARRAQRNWTESFIVWRGGLRRGRVIWDDKAGVLADKSPSSTEAVDWEVIIDLSGAKPAKAEVSDIASVVWKADDLRKDEIETILRYHALGTDTELRDEFSEQIRASLHSHNLSVDRIFNRAFMNDGKLVIDGFDYNFTEEAKAAANLSDCLSIMLEPLFETRYPEHPYFELRLGLNEVSTLVTDLYSGNRQYLAEVQSLAKTFALPLGLVRDQGGAYVPETEEHLLELPLAARILRLVDENGKEPVLLKTIYADLKKAPYGLAREAQQLILAALVAQRQLEFVTSKGDRINRRSLDLQIIWDDIIGIAKPLDSSYSAKKLVRWGTLFAGTSGFRSLDDLADREMLKTAFLHWIAEWRRGRVLERFSELPDDILNTRTWNLAARASKTLGSVAENINACLEGSISYEECLARVADAFLDKPEEMDVGVQQLAILESFVKGVDQRREIETYLALCEPTGVETLEAMKERLLEFSDRSYSRPSDTFNREMGYVWTKFHREYTEHFAAQHDFVMKSHGLQSEFDEIMRSDEWWQLSNLATVAPCESIRKTETGKLIQRFSELDCKTDVRESLKSRPFCSCSFSLPEIKNWESLSSQLSASIGASLAACRQIIAQNRTRLTPVIDSFAAERK
ncbi:MAG TPA: hypothetical protein VK468_04475, partial [Pyrinomonadaceae bacterium]|nr:hypothetical protein [Pyrinomonadaceae bacterium]